MSNIVYPSRLRLRGVSAGNLGPILKNGHLVTESLISEGCTEQEIRSGMKIPDSEKILEQWRPTDPKSFALALTLAIGWDEDIGSDYFEVYVIANQIRDQINLNRRAVIFVEEFDWPSLKQSLLNILDKCEGTTWKESVRALRKRFEWEYDGMAAYESWLK
ncbi:Imm8 family immunity protein [Mesorhizobium sp. M0220]|uniref:Imm8 family immunity protein n=1 Tax=unclassified Mesorhizobium TaxID=325217 RepID=UPI003335B217